MVQSLRSGNDSDFGENSLDYPSRAAFTHQTTSSPALRFDLTWTYALNFLIVSIVGLSQKGSKYKFSDPERSGKEGQQRTSVFTCPAGTLSFAQPSLILQIR